MVQPPQPKKVEPREPAVTTNAVKPAPAPKAQPAPATPTKTQPAQGNTTAPQTALAPISALNIGTSKEAPKAQVKGVALPPPKSYEDMFRELNQMRVPSKEELAKIEKKEKREKLFSAIGDGLSALSNLFFTTQYSPNMYSHEKGASVATEKRHAMLKAEREANMNAYIQGLQRARMADREDAERKRLWDYNVLKDAEARAERERERKYREGRDKVKDQQWADMYGFKQGVQSDLNAYRSAGLVEKKRHNQATEANAKQRNSIAQQRAAGSSSSGKYRLYNPETGQYEYFANQGSRDQRAGELGYDVSGGETVSTKTDPLTKQTTTSRRKPGKNASTNLGEQEAQKKRERAQSNNVRKKGKAGIKI